MQSRTVYQSFPVVVAIAFAACGGGHPSSRTSPTSAEAEEAPAAPVAVSLLASPDNTATSPANGAGSEYVCPMHPDVRQSTPGQCPRCGMNLVLEEGAEDNHSAPSDTGAAAQPHPRHRGHAGHHH